MRKTFIRCVICILCLFAFSAVFSEEQKKEKMSDSASQRYRIKALADAGMYKIKDCKARMDIDWKKIRKKIGEEKALDPASIKVFEIDEENETEKEIPSRFCPAEGYAPGSNEKGALSWPIEGEMAALSTRNYYIYFSCGGGGGGALPSGNIDEGIVLSEGFENAVNERRSSGLWKKINVTKNSGEGYVTDEKAHEGAKSLYMKKQGKGYSFIHSYKGYDSDIKVKPNTKYRISGWIKSEGPGDCQQLIQLTFLNKDRKCASGKAYTWASGRRTHDWKIVERIIQSPADACYAMIRIYLKDECSAWFDEIKLEELPEPGPEITIEEIEKIQ